MINIICVDGCENFIPFFQKVLKNVDARFYSIDKINDFLTRADLVAPSTTNNSFANWCFYSYFGKNHEIVNAQAKAKGQLVKFCFISGEPEPPTKRKIQLQPHLFLDCKFVPALQHFSNPAKVINFASGATKVLYLPFFQLHFCERNKHSFNNLYRTTTDTTSPAPPFLNNKTKTTPVDTKEHTPILVNKKKFCAFMYSKNVLFRNQLYQDISNFKLGNVDALGTCKNKNPNVKTDRKIYKRGIETFYDLAVDKYLPYQFVICCENSCLSGYITEKIINAYLAGAIPIYKGAPDIENYFNSKSFLNANKLTLVQLKEKIKELLLDPSKMREMRQEPIFVQDIQTKLFDELNFVKIIRA